MKLLASLIFFTRLPFWKIADVPPVYFKRVVDYWPFVGWLTGGIMAGTLWITAEFLPVQIAVLMALAARLLVTGALHDALPIWSRIKILNLFWLMMNIP